MFTLNFFGTITSKYLVFAVIIVIFLSDRHLAKNSTIKHDLKLVEGLVCAKFEPSKQFETFKDRLSRFLKTKEKYKIFQSEHDITSENLNNMCFQLEFIGT